MDIDSIKEIIKTKKYLRYLLIAFLVLIIVLYLKTFFTTGIFYNDKFLKKEVVSTERFYKGKDQYGNIKITAIGIRDEHESSQILFSLPNDKDLEYIVIFRNPKDWDMGINNIMDKDGNILFEGEYKEGHTFMKDKEGNYIFEENQYISVNREVRYNTNYKVPLKVVADLAYSSSDTIRGDYSLLFISMLLFVITLIDIKYPLFFFTLQHFIDVKDPEPSDFYLSMQMASWVILPIIGIILLIAAI